jgi:TrmH family RNA methyltransferase
MLSKNEIKFLRSLHQKKFRDLERKIVVEGERIITDIIARHPQSIERIIVSKNFSGNQSDFLRFECAAVDNQVFEQISASKNPQGVLALIHFPVFQIQQYQQAQYLHAPSLTDLENDKQLKIQLWQKLKQLFP